MGIQQLIRAKMGDTEADKFFQEARYVIALGSNDFINNYLMPIYSDSWTYNDQSFVQYLMQIFRGQITVMFQNLSSLVIYIYIYTKINPFFFFFWVSCL